jgi:acyl dehydratase
MTLGLTPTIEERQRRKVRFNWPVFSGSDLIGCVVVFEDRSSIVFESRAFEPVTPFGDPIGAGLGTRADAAAVLAKAALQ